MLRRDSLNNGFQRIDTSLILSPLDPSPNQIGSLLTSLDPLTVLGNPGVDIWLTKIVNYLECDETFKLLSILFGNRGVFFFFIYVYEYLFF